MPPWSSSRMFRMFRNTRCRFSGESSGSRDMMFLYLRRQ